MNINDILKEHNSVRGYSIVLSQDGIILDGCSYSYCYSLKEAEERFKKVLKDFLKESKKEGKSIFIDGLPKLEVADGNGDLGKVYCIVMKLYITYI